MTGTRTGRPLHAEERTALALAQIEQILVAVEQNGTELGMLLAGLLSLVDRHREGTTLPGGSADGDSAGCAADHALMLQFREPLLVVCQFHDRLRQRLEHVHAALAVLPAALQPDGDVAEEAFRLFPLPEERAVSAALLRLGDAGVVNEEVDVEVFRDES